MTNTFSAKFTTPSRLLSKPTKNLPTPLAFVSIPKPKLDSRVSCVLASAPLYLETIMSALLLEACSKSSRRAWPDALMCIGSKGASIPNPAFPSLSTTILFWKYFVRVSKWPIPILIPLVEAKLFGVLCVNIATPEEGWPLSILSGGFTPLA